MQLRESLYIKETRHILTIGLNKLDRNINICFEVVRD